MVETKTTRQIIERDNILAEMEKSIQWQEYQDNEWVALDELKEKIKKLKNMVTDYEQVFLSEDMKKELISDIDYVFTDLVSSKKEQKRICPDCGGIGCLGKKVEGSTQILYCLRCDGKGNLRKYQKKIKEQKEIK